MKILLINGGTRENSNTRLLASIVLNNLSYEEIVLRDKKIYPYIDDRHQTLDINRRDDDFEEIMDKIYRADYILFISPIYWYGLSGILKVFIDKFSLYLDKDRLFKHKLKNKRVGLIMTGGDDPKVKGKLIVEQFQYICDFLWMIFDYFILAKSNKPNQVLEDKKAIERANYYNKKLREYKRKEKMYFDYKK